MRGTDIVLILISLLFPPAAVLIMTGLSPDFVINIALTILGYTPGLIHSLWLLYKKVEAEEKWIGGGSFRPYGSKGPSYSTRDHLVRGKEETEKIWDGKWKGSR
ncbi:hypothetical protein CC1G_05254 [Coprinopsis cinerea okayama7|uniref:Stress response RCI peptide n=1 Tax=Coprinopsis cinerea (strain Okayama-7 / 130 / ATCC MYA-4618 / FGSC 9003) TaxID=240176 RepID=A8PCD2_COPC7|nr:hypothetical protein CC1G_05254 [Coprinopsis cinerea okayama7\|eukprot:XP_001840368.1 hypothetical protein CC1G_05254 [Coprinopsis cinerea okayama7\